MSNKVVWKNAEVDSNQAKATARPADKSLMDAIYAVRQWQRWLEQRKREFIATSGGVTPDFEDLVDQTEKANYALSEMITLINNFDDL